VSYHSKYGAIQESVHVFIKAGLYYALEQFPEQPLHIFEMGFGTGLNAFLTAAEAEKQKRSIHYTAVENSPLTKEETDALNYPDILGNRSLFEQIHSCKWNEKTTISKWFTLTKTKTELSDWSGGQDFNLIYYDAFPPN